MKIVLSFFILMAVSLFAVGCGEEVQATTNAPHCECQAVKLSAPEYFAGESCPKGDYLLQGIQAVMLNGQTVRGVRCVKLIPGKCSCPL